MANKTISQLLAVTEPELGFDAETVLELPDNPDLGLVKRNRRASLEQIRDKIINSQELADIIQAMVDEAASAASTALDGVSDDLAAEVSRAEAEEAALDGKITAEAGRAGTAEDTLTTNLNNEIARAKAAEASLTGGIGAATGGTDLGSVDNAFLPQGSIFAFDDMVIDEGGTGYAAGDILYINEGVTGRIPILKVTEVDGGAADGPGAVSAYLVLDAGGSEADFAGPVSPATNNAGTGLAVTITTTGGSKTTLASIDPSRLEKDCYVYVLQDETHNFTTWMYGWVDIDGDGEYNWVPLRGFTGQPRDFLADPIQTSDLAPGSVTDDIIGPRDYYINDTSESDPWMMPLSQLYGKVQTNQMNLNEMGNILSSNNMVTGAPASPGSPNKFIMESGLAAALGGLSTGTGTGGGNFTYVVDSNQAFEDWQNNVTGNNYLRVFVKSGTWISTSNKTITRETGSLIVGEAGASLQNGAMDAASTFLSYSTYAVAGPGGLNGNWYHNAYILNLYIYVSCKAVVGCFYTFVVCVIYSDTINTSVITILCAFESCKMCIGCYVSGSGTKVHLQEAFRSCTSLLNCNVQANNTNLVTTNNYDALCWIQCGFQGCHVLTCCSSTTNGGTPIYGYRYCRNLDYCICNAIHRLRTTVYAQIYGFTDCLYLSHCWCLVRSQINDTADATYGSASSTCIAYYNCFYVDTCFGIAQGSYMDMALYAFRNCGCITTCQGGCDNSRTTSSGSTQLSATGAIFHTCNGIARCFKYNSVSLSGQSTFSSCYVELGVTSGTAPSATVAGGLNQPNYNSSMQYITYA
jgi:hypothetical protein